MALFELENVRYKHVLSIDHLAIQDSDRTSIVGKSGSGKSTLVRLLNRMISPDHGRIMYNSAPIESIDPVQLRRQVVMLAQNPVIFDGDIRENVLRGREFAGQNPIEDIEVSRLLELMEISRKPDSSASSLSGGERQRVAIARVLAMQPKVLLLDEPTSALDSGTQDAIIRNLFAEAERSSTTVIMVTHATAIAEQWSNRIISIEAGSVASVNEVARHD